MKIKNILVTGANGQLGNHLRLLGDSSVHHYFYTDVAELDITDHDAILKYVLNNNIDTIVNCAAYTNVERAEDDEPAADLLNNIAVGFLADAMKQVGGLLVHVSTDYVFGGNKNNRPCSEQEPINPTGAYGRTKLAGEKAVQASGCHYIIIRTAWLYSEFGNNFVKTMLRVLPQSAERKVVFDQVGTPTFAGDLARAVFDILESRELADILQGIYHFSNEGVCSWYDFAKEIARQSGISSCNILPCHSDEFPSKVVRPSFSVLDKTKIKNTFGVAVPYWTDSLQRCMDKLVK